FILCLDFLENVGLNRAAQFRNNFRAEPPLGRGNVHCHDDRRGTADRHRRGEIRRSKIESVVEPHHVFHSVDRHAAFADLAEYSICVAVDAIKSRAIKCRTKAMRALVSRQIMKTLIRVLRQHQTGEQTRRLFLWRQPCRLRFRLVCRRHARRYNLILLKTFNLANRLKIHLAIGRVQIWKLAGQAFAKDVTCDLAGLIDFRQRKPRQWQPGWRTAHGNFRFDVIPASHQFAPKLLIGARAFNLVENELVVLIDRFNDFSEFAHTFWAYIPVIPSGVEESLIISHLENIKRCLDFARHDRLVIRGYKLAQTICPRQDRDGVLPQCQPVAEIAGSVRDVVRFLYALCERAEDRFCSPPRRRPDQASQSFATVTGCRNPDSSPTPSDQWVHLSEMASPPGPCPRSQ